MLLYVTKIEMVNHSNPFKYVDVSVGCEFCTS